MHIKDNNSPHGKFHRFLFPFSSKFPDLNFAPYVLYIYLIFTHVMKTVRDTNSEPGLPVVGLKINIGCLYTMPLSKTEKAVKCYLTKDKFVKAEVKFQVISLCMSLTSES